MGLSDFQVFNDFTYTAITEVLQQQVQLFNAATNGALVLRAGNNLGDFTDSTMYAAVADIIRRRNVRTDNDVAEKELEMLLETSVKVASGAGPLRIDPHWWDYINRSPEEGAVVWGQQLAVAIAADMLNTEIAALVAALLNETDVQHDGTSGTADFGDFLTGASKFGDQAQRIVCWVVHSKVMFDVYGAALANTASLFNFGTINVRQDGFGRIFVVTDSPALINATPNPDQYYSLGLVPGAAVIEQNDDYLQNIETTNGGENIRRTIQSQWTYNLGIKGFAWDKTSGGASPNNAALASSANWDRLVTDKKNLPGVLVKTQ